MQSRRWRRRLLTAQLRHDEQVLQGDGRLLPLARRDGRRPTDRGGPPPVARPAAAWRSVAGRLGVAWSARPRVGQSQQVAERLAELATHGTVDEEIERIAEQNDKVGAQCRHVRRPLRDDLNGQRVLEDHDNQQNSQRHEYTQACTSTTTSNR